MHLSRHALRFAAVLIAISVFACKSKTTNDAKDTITTEQTAPAAATVAQPHVFKGLYSLGTEVKSFKDCATGREVWVIDSIAQLELKYWELIPREKKDEPVYIEVEGRVIASNKSDGINQYDSTLVVSKLINITKEIPAGKCN